MKIISLAFALTLFLAACNNQEAPKKEKGNADSINTTANTDSSGIPMTGSDRDEHGCIPSAGYTWSVVLNDCIRIFEAGKKLSAADAVADKTTAAFAVFSKDSGKAELYIPNQAALSIVLEQSQPDKEKWAGEKWSLEKTAKGLVLKKDGVIQFTE